MTETRAIQAMAPVQAVQAVQATQQQQQQQPVEVEAAVVRPEPAAAAPSTAERKRSLKFQAPHALKFALAPVTRDAESGDVTLALCLFCKHFGREPRPGRKRKATANLKFFKRSFRTDQYVQHHASQHPALWARYEALDDAGKRGFFPVSGGRAPPPAQAQAQLQARAPNEIAASAPTRQERRCWFELRAPVLNLVLQLSSDESQHFVFSSSSHDARRRRPAEAWTPASGAFRSFERVTSAEVDGTTALAFGTAKTSLADARDDSPMYRIVVCSREELDAMVELAAGGLSFRQMAHTLRWLGRHAPVLQAPPEDTQSGEHLSPFFTSFGHKEHAGAKRQRVSPADGPWRVSQVCGEDQTIEFVRLATAASLQMLSQLLHATWSIGVDISAHVCAPKRSFLDVRVRFYCLGKVRSAHLLALPALERPFQLQLFHTLERALSAVLPSWRRRLVSVSTHGDAKVLARAKDTIGHLMRQLPSSARVYRVESASHEVLAVLTRFYSSLQGGGFVPMLRLMVSCIRRSPALVEMMGSDPPSARARDVTCTNWSLQALARELEWISSKREQLVEHIHRDKSGAFERCGATSDPSWWLFLVVVAHVAVRSLDLFERLGGFTSVEDQAPVIMDFASEVKNLLDAEDAASPNSSSSRGDKEAEDKSKVFYSHKKRFVVRTEAVRAWVLRDAPEVSRVVIAEAESPMVDMAWENVSLCGANMIESLVELSDACRSRRAGGGDAAGATSSASAVAPSTSDDALSQSPSALPPVTPRALAALSGREFAALVKAHASQLREFFTDEELDVVDQEHQALRRASARDAAVKAALESSSASRERVDSAGTFACSWAALGGRFRLLQTFAGGLASARPSDEPLFGPRAEEGRCALEFRPSAADEAAGEFAADFALEGALHAQQFAALAALVDAGGAQEAVL